MSGFFVGANEVYFKTYLLAEALAAAGADVAADAAGAAALALIEAAALALVEAAALAAGAEAEALAEAAAAGAAFTSGSLNLAPDRLAICTIARPNSTSSRSGLPPLAGIAPLPAMADFNKPS